jgi:hypothetical protein
MARRGPRNYSAIQSDRGLHRRCDWICSQSSRRIVRNTSDHLRVCGVITDRRRNVVSPRHDRAESHGLLRPGCSIQPQLRGTADFINGPVRHSRLDVLPNGANWNNRIASLEVGPGATATAWADVNFSGASMELRVDTRYATLPPALVGTIKSLQVRCTEAPASAP